jgi:hypothetical protein
LPLAAAGLPTLDDGLNVQPSLQDAEGGPFVDDAGQALQEQLFAVDLGFGVTVTLIGDQLGVELIFVKVSELQEAPASVADPAADTGDDVLAVGLAGAEDQLVEDDDGSLSAKADELLSTRYLDNKNA